MMRKNLFKKLLCLVLASVSVISLLACSPAGNGGSSSGGGASSGGSSSSSDQTVKPTGKFFVYGGASDYVILMPENADYNIRIARDEIVSAVENACGYKLPVVTALTEGKKYISIGETPLLSENEAQVVTTPLVQTESRVVTLGDNYFVLGYDSEYTVYAAYELLERLVGFKVYALDDIYVNKSENIEFMDINVSEIPDFPVRDAEYDRIYDGDERLNRRRTRLVYKADTWFCYGHTLITYIMKKDLYLSAHPEWYTVPTNDTSVGGIGQLCLSNEEMIAAFIERVKEMIMDADDIENKSFFHLGMEDNWSYCKCTNCTALAAANSVTGSDSGKRAANFIIFANKIAKAINEDWDWLQENYPGKQIFFPMYAYMHNEYAPVKTVDGKTVAINDNVKLDKNVGVLYAPVNGNFAYSLDDSRSKIAPIVKEWQAITSNMMYYGYCAEFSACPVPINDLITMDGTMRALLEDGAYYYQDQGATLTRTSGMEDLRYYVRSNKLWDSSRSVDDYAYEFIDYYYKPVAAKFKEYYDSFTAFQRYQVEKLGISIHILDATYVKAAYWPKAALDNFNAQIDAMLEELLPLKQTDPAAYEKYFDRINGEKIWIYYIYCDSYKTYFNSDDYSALIDFMREYCAKYGMDEYCEYGKITVKFEAWENA